MMDSNFFPLLSFVLITTFTPGPNNITSASMGVLHGYKNTLNYLIGIAAGFFMVMLLCGWVATSLLNMFPFFETPLRLIGAAYILWLAFKTLQASYSFKESSQRPMGFGNGLLLQLLNPKVLVYGLTLFSTFLAPLTNNLKMLVVSAVLLAATAFGATSTWTLFGTAIKTYLHQPAIRNAVNLILSVLLVYTALELSGMI